MIRWTQYVEPQTDDDPDEIEHELPSRWEICDECEGHGSHSRHLGAITQEDRERDWDPEEFEGYLAGAYDKRCEECKGTGKVLVPDLDVWPKELADAYCEQQREEAAYRAEVAAERRFLGY